MPARSDPPTWRIYPAAGGHFQWMTAGADAGFRPAEPSETLGLDEEAGPSSRLPSMADLLLQASAELANGGDGDGGGVPMLQTGSGRYVPVKESSIRKAASVLGGEDDLGGALVTSNGGGCDGDFSMFHTGSGKSVSVSKLSIQKAAAVLGGENPDRGPLAVQNGGRLDDGFPMLRTGLGKSVSVSKSSMRKAAFFLGGENSEAEHVKPFEGGRHRDAVPMFQTGSGQSILLGESSIRKAMAVLEYGENIEADQAQENPTNHGCSFSNTLFQTGSGEAVNISSAGILRATTLLGLVENQSFSSSSCSTHAMDQPNSDISKSTESDDKILVDANLGTTSSSRFCTIAEINSSAYPRDFCLPPHQSKPDSLQSPLGFEMCKTSDSVHPPTKFLTAGGKSTSISANALLRAKRLLGDPEVGALHSSITADKPLGTVVINDKAFDHISWNKENAPFASVLPNAEIEGTLEVKPAYVPAFTNHKQSCAPLQINNSARVTPDRVNSGFVSKALDSKSCDLSTMQNHATDGNLRNSVKDCLRSIPACGTLAKPLVEISNSIDKEHTNRNWLTSDKKRPQKRSSISPFKRPRTSRFTTPLDNRSSLATGPSLQLTSEECCRRKSISSRYPFQYKRKTAEDLFGGPPIHTNLALQLSYEVKHMNADNAEKYRFRDASGHGVIGPEDFQVMLLQSGASLSNATKKWVANHYKWIVWKLASLERCYPAQACGKYLTVSNVLEELKYRYEREANIGHMSAIKRILDGVVSPSSAVVLCISAIRSSSNPQSCNIYETADTHKGSKKQSSSNVPKSFHAAKIELTDGWYSLEALLDASLSKQLIARKLFVGQKLRILGAGLCGWVAPVSPLEASGVVSLVMHINGTYRAHWADSLGLCKGIQAPLAFRCIKGAGGKVPKTLVGVTRMYPVLYKEMFPDGGSIVRSERMEREVLQLYNQRRSCIVEDIISENQVSLLNDDDSEEGAKIFRMLQNADEPEVLMADMSSEQLNSFSSYQAKQEAVRQSEMHKKIEKAFEDAGLSAREVTPFIKVRVVGLTSKGASRNSQSKEGLITIWSPTEKQKHDLVEGQIYSVEGLIPLNLGSDVLYLQGRGSSTRWKCLPSKAIKEFEPFFSPRKSMRLSNLGELPLASEFDIAAVVIYVGDSYVSGCQKKQWVFMTDVSSCYTDLLSQEPSDCLLAVSFCSPIDNNASCTLVNHNLSGKTVGFCNLIKRTRDELNHLWVADATEYSTYSVCCNLPNGSHLKEAADCAQKWAKLSFSTIQKLKQQVLCIIGGR